MYLLEALGIADVEALDPSRSIVIGDRELGVEATTEAIRLLKGEAFVSGEVKIVGWSYAEPVYWSITHKAEGAAEIFGFPHDWSQPLPTAIEVGIVRALHCLPVHEHAMILNGGAEISIGSVPAARCFRDVVRCAKQPSQGDSLLWQHFTSAVLAEDFDSLFTPMVRSCIANSFIASPLKFRFLEIYRVMEARFLSDIRNKLHRRFDGEPKAALEDALADLKSEMNQILSLAGAQRDAFEDCWTLLDGIQNTNRFSAALFRRAKAKASEKGSALKYEVGAALVYQIRCAIVHAGEKDLIYENFADGEAALIAVLPAVERAALLVAGIELA